jgi:pimeloyl-ACP methyl ester carboxylesterase
VFRSLTPAVREQEIQRKLARNGDDWSTILRCYSVAEQPNFWPQLPELEIPCMALAGLNDKKYAGVVARMGTLPNIQARIVAACGHIVHHEQPHVFLHLLGQFLATIQPDSAAPAHALDRGRVSP